MLPLDADHRADVYRRSPALGERRRLPSDGDQQMLTLAPLPVRPSRVLVVDEPTLGLAPSVLEDLIGVFREPGDRGTSILLVGAILADAAPDVVRNDPTVAAAYFGGT